MPVISPTMPCGTMSAIVTAFILCISDLVVFLHAAHMALWGGTLGSSGRLGRPACGLKLVAMTAIMVVRGMFLDLNTLVLFTGKAH